MTAIIRAELFKLATTRAPWLAGAFMVAFASIGPTPASPRGSSQMPPPSSMR